jgi:HSP20 family molecular chaperone IbpA
MRPSNLELMHDHVRAIHRAITGSDPPEPNSEAQSAAPTIEQIAGSFAELEAVARALPSVAHRVPPFSFKPPFDLIGTEREIVVELGVPGVDAESVDASLDDDRLIISGARSISAALDGRIYLHAELPRGPFRREVRLPGVVGGRAKVEIDNGIVRVRVPKPAKSPLPQA